MERAPSEGAVHEGPHVEANLRPKGLIIRFEHHPLGSSIQALLEEQAQSACPESDLRSGPTGFQADQEDRRFVQTHLIFKSRIQQCVLGNAQGVIFGDPKGSALTTGSVKRPRARVNRADRLMVPLPGIGSPQVIPITFVRSYVMSDFMLSRVFLPG